MFSFIFCFLLIIKLSAVTRGEILVVRNTTHTSKYNKITWQCRVFDVHFRFGSFDDQSDFTVQHTLHSGTVRNMINNKMQNNRKNPLKTRFPVLFVSLTICSWFRWIPGIYRRRLLCSWFSRNAFQFRRCWRSARLRTRFPSTKQS